MKLVQYALTLCLLLVAVPASAQDAQLAKSEYQAGWKALSAKNYRQALSHYQRSFAEVPRPRSMYNIALCEDELGRVEDAIKHYQLFLRKAESRDSNFLSLANSRLRALRGQIQATLSLVSEPSGATVRINGTVRGHTPLELTLKKGKYDVQVSREGTRSSRRRIEVVAGEDATEHFSLDPVGTVSLKVYPDDAMIRRTDVDHGATGHYQADLSPGHYEFELSLMGYGTRKISLEVEPGDNIQKEIRLKARNSTGRISLRSDISGANVTIDGVIVGTMRRRDGEVATLQRRVTAGKHVVIVEPRDGSSWSKNFHLSPGEMLDINLSFKAERKQRTKLRWGLNSAGAAALVAGLTYGVLALSDVRSSIDSQHQRGKQRADRADILLGLGAVALTGAWYLKGTQTKATFERSHESDGEQAMLSP